MLAAYTVTQKMECWKNLLLHVIDSICFSNIRNDKPSFIQKEYKTNPISTILLPANDFKLKFSNVVAFYKICSGIFGSMFFSSFFFIFVFGFFESVFSVLCSSFGMYCEKLIIISENTRVLQYSNSDEHNDLPLFVRKCMYMYIFLYMYIYESCRFMVFSMDQRVFNSACTICLNMSEIWFENI